MIELNEENINILESLKVPSIYWKNKTRVYQYWFRSLLQKIDSSIVYTGLPKGWDDDILHLCLWSFGFVVVFKSYRKDLYKFGENGILFQPANISGQNFYYRQTTATIANPYYDATLIIGKDCEILALTPDRVGVLDIIDYYASKLAELSKSIDMGIINAKLPNILTAKNEAQAETLKKVYDKVQAGEPLVIWKNITDNGEVLPVKDPFEAWTQDLSKTYIVSELLNDMQTLLNSFYTEIGLPVAIEKKERLVTSETDFASAQSQARISTWVNTLNESLKVINEKYNINIGVEYARENNVSGNGKGTKQKSEINS